MDLAMVPTTERYNELVADFATERAPLGNELTHVLSRVGPVQNQFGFAASFPKGASVSQARTKLPWPF